eukprot:15310618-Heterocapsa_arctica.AAC.1
MFQMLSVLNWVLQEFLHGGLGGLCSSYTFLMFGKRSFEFLVLWRLLEESPISGGTPHFDHP